MMIRKFFPALIIFMGLVASCDNAYAKSFYVTNDGPITGVFIGSSAGYGSLLSIEVNGVQESPHQAIFNRGDAGQIFNFGIFNSGDEVTFRLDVIDTGDTWYSDAFRNYDGQSHVEFYGVGGITTIGFEDLHGGDYDFNDSVVTFYNISAVPELQIYAMLVVGLAVVGFAALRNRYRLV